MSATRFTIQMTNASKSYRNGFKDSADVGPLRFQWGQDNCVSDDAQYFTFHTSFASKCYAVITSSSMPNYRSALPVVGREKTRFAVDRDSAIDGPYPFYWIAIGDSIAATDAGYYALNESTSVFWGDATSTLDGDQTFTTPRALGSGPAALLTTVTLANVRSALPATAFNGGARTLMVSRNDVIDGPVGFNYVGIGGAPTSAPNSSTSAALTLGDFKIQWGRAVSTSDYEQLFDLPEAFADMDFAVVTTLNASGLKQGLSLTRPVNPRSFIVDRDADIDGSRGFYWLALGR